MCWVFSLRTKNIFLITDILFLNCGLEYFSLECLIPTQLLEDPQAKEGAGEGLWTVALGSIPLAMGSFQRLAHSLNEYS